MTDYISREAAYDTAISWGVGYADELLRIHAEDVAPVRHGEWIVSRTDHGFDGAEFPTHCQCSQCSREVPYLDCDAYCPRCGAKMNQEVSK